MNNDLLWMYCTQCRQTVIQNDVGLCLRCQGVYHVGNQPDSWDNVNGKDYTYKKVVPLMRQHAVDIEDDKNREN